MFEKIINREPDFIIRTEDSVYMNRWWLIPRNPHFNVYLHQFLRSDDDRALHDHPWDSYSFVLSGRGREITKDGSREFGKGDTFFREATFAHRIELIDSCIWTLFITGPKVRDWGFLCDKGWTHWKDFCDSKGSTGGGCE